MFLNYYSLAIAVYFTISNSVCPYSLRHVQYSVMARTNLTVPTAAQAVGLIPSGRMGVSGKQAPDHDVKLVGILPFSWGTGLLA